MKLKGFEGEGAVKSKEERGCKDHDEKCCRGAMKWKDFEGERAIVTRYENTKALATLMTYVADIFHANMPSLL